MITKLGIEEDKVPVMCAQLYKEYGTTMAGLRVWMFHLFTFIYDKIRVYWSMKNGMENELVVIISFSFRRSIV